MTTTNTPLSLARTIYRWGASPLNLSKIAERTSIRFQDARKSSTRCLLMCSTEFSRRSEPELIWPTLMGITNTRRRYITSTPEPHLNKGALFIFDDVQWSQEMWRAWEVLKKREGFRMTFDVGRFGICPRDEGSARPTHYDLRSYLGWLRNVSS